MDHFALKGSHSEVYILVEATACEAYNLFLAEEAAKGLPETQAKVAEENCERRFCEYGLNRYERLGKRKDYGEAFTKWFILMCRLVSFGALWLQTCFLS